MQDVIAKCFQAGPRLPDPMRTCSVTSFLGCYLARRSNESDICIDGERERRRMIAFFAASFDITADLFSGSKVEKEGRMKERAGR